MKHPLLLVLPTLNREAQVNAVEVRVGGIQEKENKSRLEGDLISVRDVSSFQRCAGMMFGEHEQHIDNNEHQVSQQCSYIVDQVASYPLVAICLVTRVGGVFRFH